MRTGSQDGENNGGYTNRHQDNYRNLQITVALQFGGKGGNNDGKNDHWRIPFLDPQFGGVVNVYNRFGELVYHTESAVVDWDGTFKGMPQSSGTYVYHIRFKKIQRADMKGTFILIR